MCGFEPETRPATSRPLRPPGSGIEGVMRGEEEEGREWDWGGEEGRRGSLRASRDDMGVRSLTSPFVNYMDILATDRQKPGAGSQSYSLFDNTPWGHFRCTQSHTVLYTIGVHVHTKATHTGGEPRTFRSRVTCHHATNVFIKWGRNGGWNVQGVWGLRGKLGGSGARGVKEEQVPNIFLRHAFKGGCS